MAASHRILSWTGGRGRGKAAKSIELIRAARDVLEEIQPASIRAVCYRLFTRGLIPDMSRNSTNRVSAQLVDARERGLIPWAWVVDETREAESVPSWADPAEYRRAVAKSYRRNRWDQQPRQVEVWSEKGTVRGTLKPVLDRYSVTFRVFHGFASATTVSQIATESLALGKPFDALYVGDWDPSGLYMSAVDLPGRLETYGAAELFVHRVALLESDPSEHRLPSFPTASKARDTRHDWYRERFGDRCWELDTLSPVVLRERVEREIRRRIEGAAWERCEKVERAERESLELVLSGWKAAAG